ncbi:MAG: YHS domain protein [Bacteroidetes bacterium]|nr:YHS domain protein [Bacteroidota bacterium]
MVPLLIVIIGRVAAQPIFTSEGVAIRGYDPVAYFKDGKPVLGSAAFSYVWQGAEWRFKDKTNMELFKANAGKYAPQFGGWCAYGVSENHKSPTEPEAFTIVNDKLYLNYNLKVKEIWLRNRDERIIKAETNWINLRNNMP